MSIWGWIIIALVALLVVVLVMRRGGQEGRDLRRELRRLRNAEGFQPDTTTPAELRRNMLINPMPGKHSTPGGP